MNDIATDPLVENLLEIGVVVLPDRYKIAGRKELSYAARKLARGVWTAQLSKKEAEERMRRLAEFQFGGAPLE